VAAKVRGAKPRAKSVKVKENSAPDLTAVLEAAVADQATKKKRKTAVRQ
jgi:hypothetical protein